MSTKLWFCIGERSVYKGLFKNKYHDEVLLNDIATFLKLGSYQEMTKKF